MNKPVYDIPLGDDSGWPTVPASSAGVTVGDLFPRARPESDGPVHDLSMGSDAPLPSPAAPDFSAPSFAALIGTEPPPAPAFPPPTAAYSPAAPAFPPPAAAFPPDFASAPPPSPLSTAPQTMAAPAPSAFSAPALAPALPVAPDAGQLFQSMASAPAPAMADSSEITRRSRNSLNRSAAAHAGAVVDAPPVEHLSRAAEPVNELAPAVGEGQEGSDPDIVEALNAVITSGASDLHITAKSTPMVRVDGGLKPVPDSEVWDADKLERVLRSIMSEAQQAQFEEVLELDFAYTLSTTARFRVNVYRQRAAFGAAFRLIPTEIKQLAALGVPSTVSEFAKLARGLVLVTGPTGSGKSTTLAALIDLVNSTRADHIVTVEDPIEFMHTNKKSLVNQREVGHDTHSFTAALKHVLRQDPDVILIGELRDLETISVALTAAETGHLVFATLHTQDAAQTIDRVIDVFPPHQQGQVRAQLAATLQGVVCQTLVKNASGKGRVVATEVLVTTPAISNLIREGKTYQIHSALQAGRELGMFTMDQHLAELVDNGRITHAAAAEKAHDIEGLKQMIHRADPNAGAFTGPATGNIELGGMYQMGANG